MKALGAALGNVRLHNPKALKGRASAPFQGFGQITNATPRAAPWAFIARPYRPVAVRFGDVGFAADEFGFLNQGVNASSFFRFLAWASRDHAGNQIMFRQNLKAGLAHVGLALRDPEEFAVVWNEGRVAYRWPVWGAL